MDNLKQLNALFLHKSRIEQQIINVNFKIGELVYKSSNFKVDEIVLYLNKCGLFVSVDFLYECMRVYRHIKSPAVLEYIKRSLDKGKFTWTFILYNCTSAPTEGEEAIRYWEKIFRKIEASVEEVRTSELPEPVKDQADGLLTALTQG